MARSKRATQFHLTKTKKKDKSSKENLFKKVQESVDKYEFIYLFQVKNMRNNLLKGVRGEWKDSRFFFGKNKVMAKALGVTPETEYRENIHEVSKKLVGEVGILFTNRSMEEVKKYFDQMVLKDYARAGFVSTMDVVLPEGQVHRGVDPFPHNMEPNLRFLGVPSTLKNGIVSLNAPHTICRMGETLTSQQAQLLKVFYIQMAEFRVRLLCCWSNGKIEEF